MVFARETAVVQFTAIPITGAELVVAVLALAIVRSLTVFPEIVMVPLKVDLVVMAIPLIRPAVPAVELVVPLVSFEMVLFEIVIVLLYDNSPKIPKTSC